MTPLEMMGSFGAGPGPQEPAAPPMGGALGQAQTGPDPIANAEMYIGGLQSELLPGADPLRQFGAAALPSLSELANTRKERREARQMMIDAYLQNNRPPIADPMGRMLAAIASAPRGQGTASLFGAGISASQGAREENAKMQAAREAAAAKANYEGLGAEADDLRSDLRTAADIARGTQPQKPKQFSTLVNEVLERRNQVFDKLVKLGADASTPESFDAIERRIDREVAPLVKALMVEYPQYKDLMVNSMPQMFASYGRDQNQPAKPVTPALTRPDPGSIATPKPAAAQVPPESPFTQFIGDPPPVKSVQGMQMKDKASEEARKENAKAASKYYTEVVQPGGDSANTMMNVVQQIRAIGPKTSRLEPYKTEIASWFESIGIKTPWLENAIKTNNSQMLLQQMANAVLLQARGVQTEGDAQRAFKQAAQISDPQESFNYKLRAMEATAQRLRMRQQLYRDYAQSRKGNYDGAEAAFARFEAEVPFVKMLPFRDGSQKAVFFNEFIRTRERQGVPQAEALQQWKEMK